jgi:hypothetical protein
LRRFNSAKTFFKFTEFFAGQALSPDRHPSAAEDRRIVDQNTKDEILDAP